MFVIRHAIHNFCKLKIFYTCHCASHNYPKVEYSWIRFLLDTNTMHNLVSWGIR